MNKTESITINLWAEEFARNIQRFVQYWSDMRESSDPQWYPPKLERGDWDDQFAEFMEGEPR